MWKRHERPAWQKAQVARLEEGRTASKRKAFRSGGAADDEREEGRVYRDERAEPTAASSSSGPAAPHTPLLRTSLPPSSLADDMSEFRNLTMTPASFQPHRHVWFVCGRPVVVPVLSTQYELINHL